MTDPWDEGALGSFIELKRGYDLPRHAREDGPHPVVSSSGITGRHAEAKVRGPGVVTGRYGTIGEVFYIDRDFWPLNTTLYVRDFKGNDPRFVSYFLKTVDYTAYTDKAAVPGVNRNHIHQLQVRFPPTSEQTTIGEMLRSLDDKIELNQRMNETLEGIARATFKSWFVDFDPVRAKLEGGQPFGLDPATAELFPHELVDSSLGLMPAGWNAATTGDIADVVRGRSYRSSELNESRTALVTLKSFLRGGGYRADGLKPFTGAYKPEQVVAPGEVVVACTDVTQAAEVVGRPAVVLPDERFETLVVSLDVVVIRPRTKGVGQSFLYFLLESEEFRAHTYAHTSGTTVLHLDRKCIPDFPFVMPSAQILEAYDRVTSPSFQRIASNVREIALLGSLRDAILPKLVSGEIRLGDAEEMAAASL